MIHVGFKKRPHDAVTLIVRVLSQISCFLSLLLVTLASSSLFRFVFLGLTSSLVSETLREYFCLFCFGLFVSFLLRVFLFLGVGSPPFTELFDTFDCSDR